MFDSDLMITLIAIAAVVGALDVLAVKYGVDSRPGFDERRPLS
jgi:hypothetical protein